MRVFEITWPQSARGMVIMAGNDIDHVVEMYCKRKCVKREDVFNGDEQVFELKEELQKQRFIKDPLTGQSITIAKYICQYPYAGIIYEI